MHVAQALISTLNQRTFRTCVRAACRRVFAQRQAVLVRMLLRFYTMAYAAVLWHVQVRTSNAFNLGMVAVLAACTAALGPLAMFKLYFVPYWVNVVWLDLVTYLHHHGPQDAGEKIPWYRGEVRACPVGVYGFDSSRV